MANNETDPVAPQATNTMTPVITPVLQSTPDFLPPVTITETSTTLTIWLPPETVLRTEAGRVVFFDQLHAFDADHTEWETSVEQKTVSGPGGILSYLRAGSNVAPTILPDLIALPTEQLAAAAAEGLIYPLDDLIDLTGLNDLYPPAMELTRFDDQIVAYPFALIGLPHLAYHSNIVTSTLPLNWDQLILDTQHKMIFPAAGREGALLALQFYLAAGGSVTNEAGEPALQVEPLTIALSQLHQGRSNGFILLQSSNVTSLDEAWQAFQTGSADLAQTSATYFLSQRAIESAPGVAPISGLDGPLTPLVEGWAWAVTTSEPQRRAAAIELLTTLVAAANLGDWSYQSNVLPARREAFTFWPVDDPYIAFLQQELERAHVNPLSPTSSIMVILGNALFDVISLTKSPQAAAEEAVAALQQ